MAENAQTAAFDEAIAHHRAGRLAQAEALYRHTLAQSPRHADALNLLGLLALQTGQAEAALKLLDQALALRPGTPDYLSHRGQALRALGRLDDAIGCYRDALKARPGAFDLLYNLGNALREAGRHEEALRAFERAVKRKPDFVDGWNNLGNTQRQLGRFGDAAGSFRAAIRLMPQAAPLHVNLGAALELAGKPDEAADALREALRLAPEAGETWAQLGRTLTRAGRAGAARDAYEAALLLVPDDAQLMTELAHILVGLDRLDEAAARLHEAVRLAPDNADAHLNFGNLLRDLGRDSDAVTELDTALRLRPDSAATRYAIGLTHLVAGRLTDGWPGYEARFAAQHQAPEPSAAPRWRGDPLDGATLLIHAEQGIGDTIQFCRFVPLAAERARVVFAVQRPLLALMRTLPGTTTIVATDDPLPPHDWQCPLLSLPHVFSTSLETIPAETPYLCADPDRVTAWRARLASSRGRTVGLAWSGNRNYAHDALRSIPAAMLALLDGIDGVTFVSLQPGGGAPRPIDHDWTDELHDFADTAALIEALDLVITVDTAVAHLAGVLGRPVWLLNRRETDWRWLREREDSPWYSTLRQFRQTQRGDWTDVLARVRAELSR